MKPTSFLPLFKFPLRSLESFSLRLLLFTLLSLCQVVTGQNQKELGSLLFVAVKADNLEEVKKFFLPLLVSAFGGWLLGLRKV
jgi:hypothetical protein